MTQLRPDIAARLLLAAGPALSPAPEPSAAEPSTEERPDATIGVASLSAADANETATASTGHKEIARSAYTDLANVPAPKVDVLVTVPVFSLLGLTDEPATLDGYGPIPASMARKLVTDGASSFYRVLVDPRDGAPLEIGRTNYRLTKAMKQAIRLRDGKCTFPGCNNHSPDNDTDHLTAWHHGGTTGISNLAQLCPKHHRLKHATGWTPTPATHNEPPGWTSPTGRHYKPEQPDPEPPQWPPGLLPAETPWCRAADTPKLQPGEMSKVQPAEKSPLEHALRELLTG
jgi:hypothetical protein